MVGGKSDMDTAKILVADDDREIAGAIEKLLLMEGFEVVKAYNGMEALDALVSNKVQLIILDIMMPKMDGLEVLTKLREQSINTPMCYDSCRKVKTMYNKNYDNNPNT